MSSAIVFVLSLALLAFAGRELAAAGRALGMPNGIVGLFESLALDTPGTEGIGASRRREGLRDRRPASEPGDLARAYRARAGCSLRRCSPARAARPRRSCLPSRHPARRPIGEDLLMSSGAR